MQVTELYKAKLQSADDIAAQIESGWHVISDTALAAPPGIYSALGTRARDGKVSGVTMNTFLDIFPMPCYDKALWDNLSGTTFFSGANARAAAAAGAADIMPTHYRDGPGLITDYVDVDAYCAVVSPMDKHGYFSTGTSASLSVALHEKANRLYLEVNENMPRALSGPVLHISQVTALCENHVPLAELPKVPPDEISETIGNLIAAEIPDGATLQLGIGGIPNAVANALRGKRDLGIHTEMLTDGMIDLLECGAATNLKKAIHKGRTVATFALGSKRIYSYIDDNPAVLMLPADYVNSPAVISQHPNFVSVNAAVEVDFFGQVSAESHGTKHISGSGGQVDYVRGAFESKGGKSFIAFSSTSKGGTVSRIVPILAPGSIVTTLKNEVDHVVTEYGIAKLRGHTLSKRTKALIQIAHPKFRDELTFAAKKQNIIV